MTGPEWLRRLTALLCAAVLVFGVSGCGSSDGSTDATPNGSPSESAAADPEENHLAPITVDEPVSGAEISSPVAISGSANVFEATVSIRILDAKGKEVAESFTTATCGTGCRGDFSERVAFEIEDRQAGAIEVYEASAEDGSQLFTVRIPVTLVPQS